MDRDTYLNSLEGMKAIGHLLIAYLALLRINSIDYHFLFNNGETITHPIKITDLLRRIKTYDMLSFDKLIRYSFDLKPATTIIESPDKENVIQLFFSMAFQVPIVRAFELIKSYSKGTTPEQYKNRFKKEDWFDVARVIRNCFSHDFKLNVSEKETKKLPYTWGNITITEEMLGKPISHKDIRIGSFTDLLTAIINSGKNYD